MTAANPRTFYPTLRGRPAPPAADLAGPIFLLLTSPQWAGSGDLFPLNGANDMKRLNWRWRTRLEDLTVLALFAAAMLASGWL